MIQKKQKICKRAISITYLFLHTNDPSTLTDSGKFTFATAGKSTLNPFTPKRTKNQNSRKIPNFILYNIEKQMVPCKSTAEEVSFEWSHNRISSTDSKVRTTLHVSTIDFGSEKVNFFKKMAKFESFIVKYGRYKAHIFV